MDEENYSEMDTEEIIDESPQGGVAVSEEEHYETEEVYEDEIPAMEQPDEPPIAVIEKTQEDIEREIAEQQAQDQRLLDALDKVLEKRGQRIVDAPSKRPLSKGERAAVAVKRRGVGFFSLGLILVFMGIVMISTLSASTPNYNAPINLSPLCAIFIGAEILITHILTHGRYRVSIPSLIISVLIVALCCILCAKLGGDYEEETVEFNNRTVAAEIYDRSYAELKEITDINTLTVSVNLNPDGDGKTKGATALSTSDKVKIDIEFGGSFDLPKDFASECKKVIDSYHTMGINVSEIHFKNKSKLRSYSLDIEGKFEQDFGEARLEEMVNYIYIDDFDYIEDLEDYTEPTSDDESED